MPKMKIDRKQLRRELLYCMVKQGYFDLNEYEREINRLNDGSYINLFLIEQMHNIIRIKLDEIIDSYTEVGGGLK